MITIKRKPQSEMKKSAEPLVDLSKGKPANQDLTLKEESDKTIAPEIPFFQKPMVKHGVVALLGIGLAVGGYYMAKKKGWNIYIGLASGAVIGVAGGYALVNYVPPFKA